MNRSWTISLCALILGAPVAFELTRPPLAVQAQQSAQQTTQQAVPDAPTPQAPKPLADVRDTVTPGSGSQQPQSTPATTPTTSSSQVPTDDNAAPAQRPAPSTAPPTQAGPDTFQTEEPSGKQSDFVSTTNFVEVPVTVKDSKGQLVAGLTFRDFRIFENNQRQQLRVFTVDPAPLSVAFVIDQSVTSDVMAKVNNSLGAIQGALTPYDDVSVFSYNNGAKEITGFTGAQSHLLTAVLALNKATGREESVPVTSGPLAGCSISSNGACVDPNLQVGRSAGGQTFMNLPKEIHTLNDAILRAAVAESTRPKGRRRIIYVVSDGKEYGSKATTKEVIKYCQGHEIAVYATLVGDSARWGQGYLSRFHIPFQMNDNVLTKYASQTGGQLDSEVSTNGIEKSYQRIAEEARRQYTLGYISHQPAIDDRFRSIEVRVNRPNVEVTSKTGYYPDSQQVR